MVVLDPGHVYLIPSVFHNPEIILKFIKRSGGAIQYNEEWPGIQTQAVMRALIHHAQLLQHDLNGNDTYLLFQLGDDKPFPLTLSGTDQLIDILEVLIDRSNYLNAIIPCVETQDACTLLFLAQCCIKVLKYSPDRGITLLEDFIKEVREALWCYEARAYRRKQEKVNRLHPTHDDTQRSKSWRVNPAEDVPFDSYEIELRPIGDDGHVRLH